MSIFTVIDHHFRKLTLYVWFPIYSELPKTILIVKFNTNSMNLIFYRIKFKMNKNTFRLNVAHHYKRLPLHSIYMYKS